jgi:hypothetical protein
MDISSNTRKAFASLSMCGFAAGMLAYILSFLAVPVESVYPWMGLLCAGMMMLFLPIFILEYPNSRSPTFFYNEFARGMPKWVAPCEWILALVALAQVIWFALHSGLGVPAHQEAQYVIESHGHVLKVISEAEYLALEEAGLRMFAAMLVSFYFVPMMYWSFRPSGRPSGIRVGSTIKGPS